MTFLRAAIRGLQANFIIYLSEIPTWFTRM